MAGRLPASELSKRPAEPAKTANEQGMGANARRKEENEDN
jgi:hypothetical protein